MSSDALIRGKDASGAEQVVATDTTGALTTGGVAKTALPTAVADGTRTPATFDKLGRQITVPYQMRELVTTAYVVLTPGSGGNTETTLATAAAGQFLDLYQITAANTSSATLGATTSVQVDIRDTTGGGIVHTMMINDDDMRTVTFSPPLPQNTTATRWTVQAGADLSSGSPIAISAAFVKNS